MAERLRSLRGLALIQLAFPLGSPRRRGVPSDRSWHLDVIGKSTCGITLGKKRKSTGRSVGNAGCGLRVAVSARAGIRVPLGAARPPRGIVGNVGVAAGRLSRCGPMWARRPTPLSRSGYLISRFFAKIAGKDLFFYFFYSLCWPIQSPLPLMESGYSAGLAGLPQGHMYTPHLLL